LELTIEAIGSIATAIATIALVVLLYRTVKQFEATVEVSKVQTEYRFRPWIGHVGSIKKWKIPPTDTVNSKSVHSVEIPDWVRNTGSWWAADTISDKEFLMAIQYLVKNGIIVV
jgi:hypothetical protein